MFKVHQGGTYPPNDLTCNPYKHNGQTLPSLSVSASKDKAGQINITLCNLDPDVPAELVCELPGTTPKRVTGRVLTAKSVVVLTVK